MNNIDFEFEPGDPEADFVHVTPCFGREHDSLTTCWCQPRPLNDDPLVWLHNAEQ